MSNEVHNRRVRAIIMSKRTIAFAYIPHTSGTVPQALILRHIPNNSVTPFVIHTLCMDTGATVLGDYHETFVDATLAFAERYHKRSEATSWRVEQGRVSLCLDPDRQSPFINNRDAERTADAIRKEEALAAADDATDRMAQMESASEAFALGGMDAYNEAMGHGVVTEEDS